MRRFIVFLVAIAGAAAQLALGQSDPNRPPFQAVEPAQAPPPPASPATPNAAAPAPSRPTDKGTFLVPAGTLAEMIDVVAKRLKINYVLDPQVKSTGAIGRYGEVKPAELMPLLETILRANGAAMVREGDLYRIIPINAVPQAQEHPSAPVAVVPSPKGPGADIGAGFKACSSNDSTPAGAVVDGFRKVVLQTPFGQSCRWESAPR